MNNPVEKSVLDEVLRKIGRNVLNFQRMESMLKYLIARAEVSGFAHELKANHEKAIDSISMQTMGNLAKRFVNSIYTENIESIESEIEITEPHLSISFRIEADSSHIEKRKSALEQVVKERNALIHQMLSTFDQTSSKSCREMIELLDAQAEKLRPEYESLQSLIVTFHEGRKEALKLFESEILGNQKRKLN
jgi:hypothetical protein